METGQTSGPCHKQVMATAYITARSFRCCNLHPLIVSAFFNADTFIFCLLVVTGEKMTEAINVSRAKVDCRYFESVNGIKLRIFVICDNK